MSWPSCSGIGLRIVCYNIYNMHIMSWLFCSGIGLEKFNIKCITCMWWVDYPVLVED